MTWWQVLLVVWAVVLAVSVLIAHERDRRHLAKCLTCPAALKFIRDRRPDWKVAGTSHRASEAERDVIAVFYMPPDVVVEPTPYQLVAVYRNGEIAELSDDVGSPYRILGRK